MSRSFTKTGNQAKIQKSSSKSSRSRSAARLALGLAMGIVVAELSPAAMGQATWVGDVNSDWNNAANWSSDPANPGGNFTINNTAGPGIFPVISATPAFTPVDVFVGTGGNTARVDHLAGTAGTGNGNWFFIGITGANATYNLANTAATGGTYTLFGQGTGSLNAGGTTQNGNLFVGLDNGTVSTLNINTSGTVAAGGIYVGANGSTSSTGTINLDSGTVTASGEIQIGSSFFGNGKNGTLNVSGGTMTGNIISFARGGNNAAAINGTATITGGTLNSRQWFTLGYAGSASNLANVTNSGGTINVNTQTGGAGVLEMGVFDATNNTFTQNSGSVNLQNNASISFGQGGNHTGTSTFNQNGGTVTFYSDSGTTVGGTGSVNLGNGNSTGTYVYNLNGGALTVPSIRKVAAGGSGTFNFNGGTLKPTGNNTTFMGGLTRANVRNGGAIIDSNSFNVTIAQPLLHTDIAGDNATDGGLTKIGAGKLTLGGANTYTGDTNVNDGRLAMANGSSLAGNVIVASGKAFEAGTSTVAGLSFPGAADFTIEMGSISTPGNTAPLTVTNALGVGTDNVVVNVNHTGTWSVGTYNLASAGSITGDPAKFVKGTVAGVGGRQSAAIGTSGSLLQLTITGALPIWKGTASTNWSTNAADKPWDVNGADGEFINGDVVRFDDSATGSTSVNVVGTVSPALATFENSTKNYTLGGSGSIAGTGSIVKAGTGLLTINNANTYSGGTALNGGQLNINNASALGTGALTVASGATIDNTSGSPVTLAGNAQTWSGNLTFGGSNALNTGTGAITRDGSTTLTVSGFAPLTLGGATNVSGTLTKLGTGTLAVSGALTAAVTDISNGSLVINSGGSVTSSTGDTWVGNNGGTATLTINSGGTLNANTVLFGGNNTTGGTATVSSGGTLNAKNWLVVGFANGGVGTLNVNGGTINVRKDSTFGNLEVGTWDAATSGTVNMDSGSLKLLSNSQIIMGVNGNHTGTTTFNQNGGDVTFYSDQGTTAGGTGNTIVGNGGTGNHTYNLNGGTLSTGSVVRNAGTGTLNLNGGTLKATRPDAVLINNLSAVNVGGGGAIIDTNGNNVSVNGPLLHATGAPATDGGLTKNGAGTLRIGGGLSTYTGNTVINGGTLQLPTGVAPAAVGHYSFDELADGSLAGGTTVLNTGSGAGMNGSVNHADHILDPSAGGASVTAGQFGKALSLDGLGSSVDVASKIVDQAGGGSWTLSAWVKTATSGSSILSKNDANVAWNTGDSVFYLGDNPISGAGGGLPTAVRNAGGFIQGNQAVNDDAWHMVTYVDNAGAKQIYVDGAAVTMNLAAFNNADPSTMVRLGYNINTLTGIDGSVNYAGLLDEIQFYGTALNGTQVQQLFQTNALAGGGSQYLPAGTAVSMPVTGAALDLNSNNQTIGSLSGVAGTSVALGNGTLTTGGSNASTTFGGQIAGAGGLTKVGTGTMHLTGPVNNIGGAVAVSAGTLEVASGGGSNRVLKAGSISITGNGAIDLKDNKLITETAAGTASGGTYSGLQGEVQRASNFGAWDQPGLTTSMPDAIAGLTTIGIATGEQIRGLGPTDTDTFAGQTITGASTIAMYTYAGDANLDGTIDGGDYGIIDNFAQIPGADGYANGDFNYDSVIDGGDYGIIDNNNQAQGAPFPTSGAVVGESAGLSGVTAVPEPASLSIIGLAAASLVGRRRRRLA